MKTVKILVVEPKKQPYEVETKTLDTTLYGLVYYPYKKLKIGKDIYLIYSKETKDNILKKNRVIDKVQIYGTFVILKQINNKTVPLTDVEIEGIKKYIEEGDDSI